MQDTAVKVFSSRPLLTAGHEHLDCDWEGMWRDVLNDKMEAAHTGLRLQAGWNTSVCLEAHAVKIRDAAAPGECLDCLAMRISCKPELAHSPGVAQFAAGTCPWVAYNSVEFSCGWACTP